MNLFIKNLNKSILMLLGFFASQSVWAYCTPSTTTPTVTLDNTAIQADIPVGTIISTGSVTFTLTCDRQGLSASETSWFVFLSPMNTVFGRPISGLDSVVPTNVSGVGLRWQSWNDASGTIIDMTSNQVNDERVGTTFLPGTVTIKDTFFIVKTGPIKAGVQTVSLPPIAKWYRSNRHSFLSEKDLYSIQFTPFIISNMTCTIDDTDLNVYLGDIQRSDFSGVGSTSSTVNFNIGLSCLEGTRINLTLSNQNAISGFTGTIGLEGSNAAGGVGIQVVDGNGIPVSLGDRHFIAQSSSGKNSIPLGAHYIQTSNDIKAGSGNAALIFTIDYI